VPGNRRHGNGALILARLLLLSVLVTACGVVRPETRTLRIHTAAGTTVNYHVEVATTSARQHRGLMFRKSMTPDHGMLFVYHRSQTLYMWMKNTYLPLDMLFIDEHGRIATIAAHARPLNTDIISSGTPVRAVLELNAGEADRHGVKVGDRVEWGERQ